MAQGMFGVGMSKLNKVLIKKIKSLNSTRCCGLENTFIVEVVFSRDEHGWEPLKDQRGLSDMSGRKGVCCG